MKRLDDIVLKDQDRRAIQDAARLLRANLPVEQVILFGSKARGEDDPQSDIDLLLLTRHPFAWEEEQRIVELLSPLQMEYDVLFNTIGIPVTDWFDGVYRALPLRGEVEQDGAAA